MDASRIESLIPTLELPGRVSKAEQPPAEGSFAAQVGETLAETNKALNEAEHAARQLAEGKGDIVESMIALGKADVSLRLVVNLRNRMLESYQEIMRLQV